ncbi:hypothetical protein [Neobacillus jeddahensis]|uniref:hypothetical protein n=1 Tax=Neobacillus jeddahensis TaxID=1461580 RepID=UPI000A52F306|nr:hypothetical protein [Neobacillus jeddahensis]
MKTVDTTFHEKEKKTNEKSGKVEFFLPKGYEVKEESPTNIILKGGSNTYILFINPQEEPSSDVVYKATIDQYKNLDINKTYKQDHKFGFLTIKQLDNDKNEMTIGVGGAKITTQVKTSKLVEESKVMMQMVNSVNYNQ